MNELDYENNLKLLGQLRDRMQRLEETDYVTASYKGYSNSGATLSEIQDEMDDLQIQITALENELDELNYL